MTYVREALLAACPDTKNQYTDPRDAAFQALGGWSERERCIGGVLMGLVV